DQQHPLQNSTAESLILLRVLEKLHHLDQFFLRLIDAFEIREGNTGFLLDINLRLALTDLHQPAPRPHPFEEIAPQKKEQYNGDNPREQGGNPLVGHLAFELNASLLQIRGQFRVINSHNLKGNGVFASLSFSFNSFKRSADNTSFMPSGLISPRITFSPITTFETSPFFTKVLNWLYVIVPIRGAAK